MALALSIGQRISYRKFGKEYRGAIRRLLDNGASSERYEVTKDERRLHEDSTEVVIPSLVIEVTTR